MCDEGGNKRNDEEIGAVDGFLDRCCGTGPAVARCGAPPVIVGRVTDVEADLLRYVPKESDWVAAIRDVPFAAGDTFYSGNEGRADLMAPNGGEARIGSATQIQFIALDANFAEADVAAGQVRLYNNGRDTVIKPTAPSGMCSPIPDRFSISMWARIPWK